MIKQLGTKLYYCTVTGNAIKIIGDMQGYVKETTFEEDYKIYTELSERDINTIDVLKYEHGVYPKISDGATSVSVDLEKKIAIFIYEELPPEPQEPALEDIVKEQGNKISNLEKENKQLKQINSDQDNLIVDNAYKIAMFEIGGV